jgi:uncharacterized phiE125 gp8 family phage protein
VAGELIISELPEEEPVTLAEAKAFLRVTESDEDALITSAIKVGRSEVEKYIGQTVLTTSYTYLLDEFPPLDVLTVPRGPINSVTSIKYIDPDGVSQTLSTDVYDVDTRRRAGRIGLKAGQCWPATKGNTLNAVEIEFTAGMGDEAAAIDEDIKTAIKLVAARVFENREGDNDSFLPFSAKSLLWKYRRQ